MTVNAGTLADAIRGELEHLWCDMAWAIRRAHRNNWSVECDDLAKRITTLSLLVGPTPWGRVDVTLLRSGVYERVHRDAGIEYPTIDKGKVERLWQDIQQQAAR